jgi:hypothetical protein
VITGGLGAYTQVTVLEAVDELPQASTAVNVLTCEAEHDVVDTLPSVNVMVAALHASEAVAVPSAALISEAVGLQPRVLVLPVGVITGGV